MPVRADITFYDIFKIQRYSQTSTGQPLAPVSFQGDANVTANSPGDLTGGTVTSASPASPMTLTGSNGNYSYGAAFATKAQLDTTFPNNTTYTFNLTGGNYNGVSATLTLPASDQYASTVPYFTGSTYTMLQGVNSSQNFDLNFNSFGLSSLANFAGTYITITDIATGTTVFSTSGSNSLTSALVAGGTLQAGTQYDVSVDFSERFTTTYPFSSVFQPGNPNPDYGFSGSTSFWAYDLGTDAVFTTAAAAPEPSNVWLILAGLSVISFVAVRPRRNRA